jgi:carboxyl-terminal processing protease
MKDTVRFLGIVALIIVCLGLGLGGGIALDRQISTHHAPASTIAAQPLSTAAAPADTESSFALMREAWDRIQKSYVDRQAVDDQLLTYGAISGMVDALGDTGHSRFLSPEMVQQERDFTSGQFEGIGAYVEMKDGEVVIVAAMDGTPAQKAGLRPGDVIIRVDGENVTGLPIDQVISRILGPSGTQVTLTLLRPSTGETLDVTLTRARITIHNVVWAQLPGSDVAHLRIVAFSQGVADDLRQALNEIHQQGLTSIVLDLRNNPGGLLNEAVGVASQFLDSGNVLLEKDAQGTITAVPVEKGGLALDAHLVVLVDQGTASAAEIVSGALQDAARAKLVGETTFGTGTVLQEFGLSDGSALLLATEEWLTPGGRVIWHVGITPDVVVALPPNTAPLLPEAEAGMTPEQLRASGDDQLLLALELLTGAASEIVTLHDDGQTITMNPGQRFLLDLGEEYDWIVNAANSDTVSRVVNATVIPGAQGLYEAHNEGSTSLTASGDPVCRQAQLPCAAPSRNFTINIVVK